MLKLKRVELQGFKSFPDRTELRFPGVGLAAIVGPNGCGKSNIADAINWVLGEQSAKTLRGARMEDVIFAGTRDRKPLGLASVSIALVDLGQHFETAAAPPKPNGAASGANGSGHSAKALDPTGREITITRRLFRSGESEYLIDGRIARLRDIQDIFMGAGLGPETYAIIEQGRIGQILSSRPQDRRAIIEEAAGISKFKARRRLAEARLEGAKHNLERVFDILEEVGRQANSLKRQAAKARRYEELKTEMNAQLGRVLAARYTMLEREAAKLALDLNLAAAAFESLSAEAAAKEREFGRLQALGYETEALLTEARKRQSELNLDLERTRGRLDYQAKQAGSIEQRVAHGEAESQDLEARLSRLGEELAAQRESLAVQERQTEAARECLDAKGRERDSVASALAGRERTIETSRQLVLRLLDEAAAIKNQLAQIDAYLAALDRDSAKAQKEEQAAASDLEWLGASKAELSTKLSARQLELESIADRRRRIEDELAARKRDLSEARQRLETARAEFSQLKARRDSLEEILSHRAYTTESVKKLFTAIERGEAEGFRPLGVLADFVEVESAYEKAAEEFLHDELEYIVVENWPLAEAGIEIMRTSLEGRATFLVRPQAASANAGGDAPLSAPASAASPSPGPAEAASQPEAASSILRDPGIVAPLSQVVRFTNALSASVIGCLPRLAQCFIAADRAAAQRLAAEHPGLSFLLPDGVCYHGRAVSGGRKSSSGPLALKRELRESKALVQALQNRLDQESARIESFERDIARLEQELERLRSAQQDQEKETVALDHEMRKLAEEHARAASHLSLARIELERVARERERSSSERQRNLAALQEKDRTRSEHETALQSARTEIETLKARAARIGEEHSALRVELAGLEERSRAGRDALARLEAQSNELLARSREVAADLERLGAERARLLADNLELDRRIAALAAENYAAEAGVLALAEKEASLRADLAALEETLKQLRLDMQQAQQKRSEVEVELVKRQAGLKYLDETSRKELSTAVADLPGAGDLALDDAALAALEARYEQIRGRIEALGPVNPEALAEYREAQARYDFLNTQRQDLLDAIRDTDKAIQDIDVESRKRFADAFAAINAHFRDVFVTLFGGGTGEMRLTGEANASESGIDIVASPPGKRLQNVLLLSGGEKALIALALLVAVFRYQPSPFCILDEVDAPLDEPNIQRLTRLLEEMSCHTQIVIITHAKRTMEAAQSLFGVTMQEPGVSKLVSVRFNGNMPLPAPPIQEVARA